MAANPEAQLVLKSISFCEAEEQNEFANVLNKQA